MTVVLDTAFADVRGETLRWALGLAEKPALASREIHLGHGRTLTLAVLGASHQVLLRDDERIVLSETVACDLTGADSLPGRADRPDYRFESRVTTLSPDELAATASELAGRLGAAPDAVVATFPGMPHAMTALSLTRPGTPCTENARAHMGESSWGWETWHCYPQTGEVVHTTTSLRGRTRR